MSVYKDKRTGRWRGVDLGAVGAVLGHKSTATTKRYAHYGVQRLAEALKRRV